MRFEEPTKLDFFLDGFRNILCILDCYNDGDEWGYDEFWERLSIGWYREYIFPYDDPYNLTISPERKLRLDERLPTFYVSEEDYDALVERLQEPPDPAIVERVKQIMNRKAPWDDDYDAN